MTTRTDRAAILSSTMRFLTAGGLILLAEQLVERLVGLGLEAVLG